MTTTPALLLAVLLLAANAFFVSAEFALVAARRHRLRARAAEGSRAAATALAATEQLTVMLAGAQLGITVCTVGLGAVAEPALAALLAAPLAAVGLGDPVAHTVAFLVALVVVVFGHMVVGEMVPKSWAITDPERAAVLVAIPFRWFATAVRPVLLVLNGLTNGLVRLVGVTPRTDTSQVPGPEELRLLVRESREQGYLAEQQHHMLSGALRVRTITVADVMVRTPRMITVAVGADAVTIESVSLRSGRSRLVVVDNGGPVGLVHIRDAVRATADTTARALMTPPLVVERSESVAGAVETMRRNRSQLALVRDGSHGPVVGLVALEDLLEQIVGGFDDETDRLSA